MEEDKLEPNDELLYHYTDYIAMDGIVNKQELRVNNVLNMNDAAEMDLFISGIFNAVEKRFTEKEDENIIKILNQMLQEVRKRYFDYSVYAACFSGLRDDAAQWERYANRGKGVCLCVRKSVLEKLTGGALSLQKVFYQNDLDSHPMVDQIYNLLKGKRELKDVPDLRETLNDAWRTSASFKHPSFLSENETRLILMPFADPDFDVKPEYHVAKDRIKKYYPLNLDDMCRKAEVTLEDLIIEVIVGPESTQSIPILRDYLADLGFKKLSRRITHSDCPLRSKL